MTSGGRPAAAAAATAVLVGVAIVASRAVIYQVGPASLALLRYFVALCCLLPAARWSVRVRFERRDLLPICLLGVTQFGILIVLLNYALRFIPSARAALVFSTMPLLTMVFSAARGHERLTTAKAAGVLLTVLGVAVALGERAVVRVGAPSPWIGDLAVLASATSGALCTVFYQPFLRKYPTLPVSTVAMLAAVVFLTGLAAGEGFFGSVPRFTAGGWLAVLFIGMSSGIGYYLWLWALNHTTPTRVTVFLALSPVTAAGVGAAFLGERISLAFVSGLICVVLGLWLSHRER